VLDALAQARNEVLAQIASRNESPLWTIAPGEAKF
jgi:hypothetical protein